jgi:chain length determinant protein EpsF
MSFQQFLSILIARKKLILSIFAIVVVTTTLISLVMPKSYTAVATILVDVKTPDPVTGGLEQAMIMPGYMATQVDIIGSERVARRVVKTLGLDQDPNLVAAWKEETDGVGTVDGYYAAILSKKLDIKPSRESNVISIEFTNGDPKLAASVANAFADAYLNTSVELTVEPAKRYTEWFVERAKQVRDKLQQQQAALSSYQKEKGIVSVDERLDVENTRLNDLSTQLTLLGAQKSDAMSRQEHAQSSIDSNPDVMNNPVIQNLRTTITAAEGKLHEASNELGENHPQIKQQTAELESLKAKLKTEMVNVASSLGINTQVSIQKEDEIRAALEKQKQRVLDLKHQHDTVSVLQKDVETTQRDYDGINQRLNQTNLQSQSQQTNISILTPASEPDKPSKPKVLLNILVSIFLGVMLGVGVAMLLELNSRRIRSIEDLAELGIPVLGELTKQSVPGVNSSKVFGYIRNNKILGQVRNKVSAFRTR